MPFVIPQELWSIGGNIPISQYKNIDESTDFILQKRKSSGVYALATGDEPLYRVIITTEDVVCMIAFEDDWKTMQNFEWRYILYNFPALVPESLSPDLRSKWILAHFTQLAVETTRKNFDVTSDQALSSAGGSGMDVFQPEPGDDSDDNEEISVSENSRNSQQLEQETELLDTATNDHGSKTERKVPPALDIPMNNTSLEEKLDLNETKPRTRMDSFYARQAEQQLQRQIYARTHPTSTSGHPSHILPSFPKAPIRPKEYFVEFIGIRLTIACVLIMNFSLVLLRDMSQMVFILTQAFLSLVLVMVIYFRDPVGVRVTLLIQGASEVLAGEKKDTIMIPMSPATHEDYVLHDLKHTPKGKQGYLSIVDRNYRAMLPPRLQTLRPHRWADANPRGFMVRHGPNYFWTKYKSYSEDSLYHLVGVDIFRYQSKTEALHLCSKMPLTGLSAKIPHSDTMGLLQTPTSILSTSTDNLSDELKKSAITTETPNKAKKKVRILPEETASDVPELLVINFLCPMYNPVPFSTKEDGEGRALTIYFALKDSTRELASLATSDPQQVPPSINLLQRFMYAVRTGGKLLGRLKAIPRLCNISDLNLNVTLKALLEQYNAKPFLTGPLYHTFYHGKHYIECDVDIHRYCYWARKAAFDIIRWLPEARIELAFVIEAQDDAEMPEQVLGSVLLNSIHPDEDSQFIPDFLQASAAAESHSPLDMSVPINTRSFSSPAPENGSTNDINGLHRRSKTMPMSA